MILKPIDPLPDVGAERRRDLGQIWGKTVFGNSPERVPIQFGISLQAADFADLKAHFLRQNADAKLDWGRKEQLKSDEV
jgi:hypothetical protein